MEAGSEDSLGIAIYEGQKEGGQQGGFEVGEAKGSELWK